MHRQPCGPGCTTACQAADHDLHPVVHYVGDGCLPGTEPPAIHLRSTTNPGTVAGGGMLLVNTECGQEVLVDNEHATCPACRQVDRDRTLALGGNQQALDRLGYALAALGPDALGPAARQEVERLLATPRPYDHLTPSERAWLAASRKTARRRAQLVTCLAVTLLAGCGWLVRAARRRKEV